MERFSSSATRSALPAMSKSPPDILNAVVQLGQIPSQVFHENSLLHSQTA